MYEYEDHTYILESLNGMADFDSLWRGTDLTLRLLLRHRRTYQRIAVFEPTQGHLPVLLTKYWPDVASVSLASRDRLALDASAANLRRNGFAGEVIVSHAVDVSHLPTDIDLLIFQLYGGERTEIHVRRIAAARARFPACPIV